MGRDFSLADLQRDYQAVFLATGAPRSRPLGVSGDQLRGVIPATRFLKDVNLGPAPTLSGAVVVVGGGSTAMDAARSAWRSGAASVTILYRRGLDEMPAQPEEVDAARREGIEIRTGTSVTEVLGMDGAVVGVRVVSQEPSGEVDGRPPGLGSGRRLERRHSRPRPSWLPSARSQIPSILPVGAGIEIGARAGIVADPRTLATGLAGVFAGGDVVSGPKTIIDAVAAGRRAAGAIHEYLGGSPNGEAEILATVRYRTPPEPVLRLDLSPRSRASQDHPVDRNSFVRSRPRRASPRPSRSPRPAAASAATRSHGCPTVQVLAGRGPADRPIAVAIQAGGDR